MVFDGVTEDRFGVYHGVNAAVALTPGFCQAFLRLAEGHIICVLHFKDFGAVAVIDGHACGAVEHSDWCCGMQGEYACSTADEGAAASLRSLLQQRDGDTLASDGASLTYRMADGNAFECQLAEAIDIETFFQPVPVNAYPDIAQRMRAWNRGMFCNIGEHDIRAFLSTSQYNFCFNLYEDGSLYCRAGINGYCSRGWAMLSTTCLRTHECRMLPNNLDALQPYYPREDAFVEDGCTFPSDGGWYWSIKEVTDDVIRLNGCGGDTYAIYRPQ